MFNFFLPLWVRVWSLSGLLILTSLPLIIVLYLVSRLTEFPPLYLGGCYMSGWERRVGWWGKEPLTGFLQPRLSFGTKWYVLRRLVPQG
ncbi:hypothetical protein BC629DRAFT_1589521 [Irpex lacteus]|nr:hypothetical protein BC629DRAFT_1589521 [Irpex lacteus]